MLKIDHIFFAAEGIAEGISFFAERLKVSFDEGRFHDQFGTHNKLLNLGDCYFELIAINAEVLSPNRAFWYDPQKFLGLPRIIILVCETFRMSCYLIHAPYHAAEILPLSRGS